MLFSDMWTLVNQGTSLWEIKVKLYLCSTLLLDIVVCRRELYKKVVNFVHLNLSIALICGLLVFVTGIQTATWSKVSSRTCIHTYVYVSRLCAYTYIYS